MPVVLLPPDEAASIPSVPPGSASYTPRLLCFVSGHGFSCKVPRHPLHIVPGHPLHFWNFSKWMGGTKALYSVMELNLTARDVVGFLPWKRKYNAFQMRIRSPLVILLPALSLFGLYLPFAHAQGSPAPSVVTI